MCLYISDMYVDISDVCVCVCVCMHVCDMRKNMVFGETSLIKAESLYAYYNAMLIQKINFRDMYTCIHR